MKPYERLQQFWKLSDAQIAASGVSEMEVQGLEQRYGIRLPDDFREYMLHACPRIDGDGDDDATTWWHLDRIKNIPDEYDHRIGNDVIARDAAKYIFFSDYAIWCMAWAICCDESENRGRIALVGPDRFAADSFAQFVDMYVEDGGGGKRLSAC